MSKRFFPRSDDDFSTMAWSFALKIANEPARFGVSQADSDALGAAVDAYRAALQEARCGSVRGPFATRRKTEARKEAQRIIHRLAAVIRVSEQVDPAAKAMLKLLPSSARPRPRALPPEPPRLRFVRARHEGNGSVPVHELEFREFHTQSKARPAGATRVELFVDLIEPDARPPAHPGANGRQPWYFRSYPRNPIILTPPMARMPMRVVYWARWADAAGNVGPFSATAVGWVEGGSHLPALSIQLDERKRLKLLDDPRAAREGRDQMVVVAVMEAQYHSLQAAAVLDAARSEAPALPAAGERRQLEGPAEQVQDGGIEESRQAA